MGVEGEVTVDISDKTSALLTWKDGHVSKCNVKWLRFHCHCERCFRPFSGMYLLDKPKFPDDLGLAAASIEGENLQFTTDYEIFEDHESKIPLKWLRLHCNCRACIKREIERREVRSDRAVVSEMNYEEISDGKGMHRFLENVLTSGYCLMHGVPDNDNISLKIGERIGPTFFALFNESTEVQGTPKKGGLELHQNMPFYEVLPGVQVFYVKRHDGTGEAVLADLFYAAENFRMEALEHFNCLVKTPATFEYKNGESERPLWYEIQKPHIEVDYFGKIVAIHWNPDMEGPLRVHAKDVLRYCKAHKAFAETLKAKANQVRLQLREGDILVTNNHRMAHFYDGFAGNDRVAIRSFLNIDDLKSTYIVLAHKLGLDFTPLKVGNRSSF